MNRRIINWEYDWNFPIVLGGPPLSDLESKVRQAATRVSALTLQQFLPRLAYIGTIHE